MTHGSAYNVYQNTLHIQRADRFTYSVLVPYFHSILIQQITLHNSYSGILRKPSCEQLFDNPVSTSLFLKL